MPQPPKLEAWERPAPPLQPEASTRQATQGQGPQVLVRGLRVEGNRLLSAAQLAAVLQPFLNRQLDLTQLEQAAQTVAQRYREDGWIVTAYLPAQDITSGDVLIRVDEAQLGLLRFNAPSELRGPQAQAQRYFERLLAPGQPLNADHVARAQQISSELLGLSVAPPVFKKGQTPGTTDLDVVLSDKPLWAVDGLADNGGARATGVERLNALIEWRNPLRAGDQWNMAFMKTQGSDSARLGVGLPVGDLGWRIGASLGCYSYRLIAPEYVALNASGTVDSLGLDASYPWVREHNRSLTLVLNADRKAMDNLASGQTNSRYSSQSASVTLQGRQSNTWLGGGGHTTGSLALTAGRLNLNGSPSQSTDAQGPRTDGQFSKLRATLSRAQYLTSRLTLQLSHNQQWANKNLDSSEKFYIGGPDSVRAFPVNEAGGAQGSLSSAELQWQLDSAKTLFGFYDHGQVSVQIDDQFSGATQPNRYRLQGAGLGMQWRPAEGWFVKATWARRLQANPRPSTGGKDQDGTLLRDRLWVTAIYSF
ncbi:ShlB/FhaC/HecB family hemolysin secretion/activation protein [Limnohabitans sp. G3-2]|uniref:ShlB/FhaC/HecB family hemolysin secretion/activation protein n=1 Tax=Limnohabitans sp. G3-2 TaxID=1100711 RepID=UPI0013047BBD|nr:ShlB/FhaC/HecB family hemolysin secretion/activation protein [Limnohabitans sp. G3-2]